ncbi:MAG TPA: hypothetical protein VHC50_08305 [Puia sp.]|nr:hypothetical protein [Puia sp.]
MDKIEYFRKNIPSMSTTITDDYMRQMMTTTKPYTVVILTKGPNFTRPDAMSIIWEHGRRNFQLRADGLLSVVFPIRDDSDKAGVGIFNADAEQTKKIIEGDPAIIEGILQFEIHPTRSFPGDSLP